MQIHIFAYSNRVFYLNLRVFIYINQDRESWTENRVSYSWTPMFGISYSTVVCITLWVNRLEKRCMKHSHFFVGTKFNIYILAGGSRADGEACEISLWERYLLNTGSMSFDSLLVITRVVWHVHIFIRMRWFLLTLDTFHILCLVYSVFFANNK